ncbi:MAG TPA: hypothetical protein VMD30_02765 [Tepidisphaeraceae bacterium]|nr:hypothetical protein [Tepidisphaeraceae bacterium]
MPSAPAQIQVVPLAKPASWPKTISLKRYVLNDDQMFHTAILSGVMPADWNVKGGVIWKMQLGTPDLLRIHWGDAQDVRGFDVYPYLTFCWGQRIQALGIPTYMGSIVQAPPSDQFDAIDKVIIPFFRQDLADARVVNQQKAPDVAKAEYDKLSQMYPGGMFAIEVWSGSETFEYDKNGQTIQEVVSVTLDEAENRRLGNITWSISSANSVRAPKGELDQLAVPRTVIFQSIQANPDWNQQVADFLARRQGQLAVRQQNQFDQTENRINAQTSANDAEHQQFNQHMSDLDRQSDAEADVQREVSPWTTSDGTSCKLPTQYGYAWSGADGRIIMNNDPQYNPNSDPNLSSTNWTAMQQAGN